MHIDYSLLYIAEINFIVLYDVRMYIRAQIEGIRGYTKYTLLNTFL